MVFLGANVFFPKYTGSDSYYNYNYQNPDCYGKYPSPTPISETNPPDEKTKLIAQQRNEQLEECLKQQMLTQQQWEQDKNQYEGMKYIFIIAFNFIILLIALFLPKLQDSVTMGLFLSSIVTTFGATIRYFDSKSKIGFIILVITFFLTLYFINKKKDTFVDWKEKK
jgi:hypothetical protein